MATKKTLARRIRKLEVNAAEWKGPDYQKFASDMSSYLKFAEGLAMDVKEVAKHLDAIAIMIDTFGRHLSKGETPARWKEDIIEKMQSKLPKDSKQLLSGAKKLVADLKKLRDDARKYREQFENATIAG